MTKFILCNISVFNSVDDKNLNTSFFKTAAFNARINNKKISKINYNLVLVPYKFYSEQKYDKEKINNFKQKCSIPKNTNDYNIIYSLYEIFNNYDVHIEIIDCISKELINIFYSDGSVSSINETSSFGVVKLLKESNSSYSDPSLYDIFTESNYTYETFSGTIDNGTNNIGELNGIKNAIENYGSSTYQVIISDSEYSIKVFREWIYNWEKNNYKTYSNKNIQNATLIKNIKNEIDSSKKIYFFKWVKGHDGCAFNELCDSLAKKELGIKK